MDKYYLQNGEWTIARYMVFGEWVYVLWHKSKWMGKFTTEEAAKKSHQDLNGMKNEDTRGL